MLDIHDLGRLAGKQLLGPGNERIGKIADVYASNTADGGTFATVTTGLLGASVSFFPLDAAELDGDQVRVPYGRDFIKHAPQVDNEELLTPEQEDRLFTYYGLGTTAADPSQHPVPAAAQGGSDDSLTLSEERLRIGTERVVAGRARLRKYVVAETVTHTVPVRHEELRVFREPIAATELPAPDVIGPPLSEEEHEVLLFAERPVVHKDVVPVERIRLDTVTVEGEQTITDQLRKEHMELEEDQPEVDPGSREQY